MLLLFYADTHSLSSFEYKSTSQLGHGRPSQPQRTWPGVLDVPHTVRHSGRAKIIAQIAV
eukprot:6199525-Pleurochrysis_carterae.AAC.7